MHTYGVNAGGSGASLGLCENFILEISCSFKIQT